MLVVRRVVFPSDDAKVQHFKAHSKQSRGRARATETHSPVGQQFRKPVVEALHDCFFYGRKFYRRKISHCKGTIKRAKNQILI